MNEKTTGNHNYHIGPNQTTGDLEKVIIGPDWYITDKNLSGDGIKITEDNYLLLYFLLFCGTFSIMIVSMLLLGQYLNFE